MCIRDRYNTVVSGAMKMLNALEDFKPDGSAGDVQAQHEGLCMLLRCLYPVTPHVAQELWKGVGYHTQFGELLDAPWPAVDPAALEQDEVELMLQVNGKLRGAIRVPSGASRETIEAAALANDMFIKLAAGAPVKKVIVVPGRLVNVVL